MFHHDWCKEAVVALKANKPVKPYHVFLSGPGGVGKSHVIKLIHSYMTYVMGLEMSHMRSLIITIISTGTVLLFGV